MGRRAKQESADGAAAKAAKAPKSKSPAPGHNSQIDEGQFLELVNELESAERKKDETTAGLRNTRKRMKDRSVDLKALDFVRRNLKGYTEPEIISFVNNILLYSRHLRVPVVRQMDLLERDEPKTDEQNLAEAEASGETAYRSGGKRDDCPHPDGTPLWNAWMNGYDGAHQAKLDAIAASEPATVQ